MVRRMLAFAVSATVLVVSACVSSGAPAASAQAVRIAAVGDIACKDLPKRNKQVCQYDDVAAAIERGDYDRFLAARGHPVRERGVQDFVDNYDVYFGDLMPITEPVPGNHEYGTADAAGYYRYFGDRGHGPDGYYSYDLGGWHIIALNSAICPAAVGLRTGRPAVRVAAAGPAANDDAACTLAYWHHPRFDWLKYQNADWTEDYEFLRTKPFWDLLSAADADVVLSGHNHNYRRWKPMDAERRGRRRPASGSSSWARAAAT